MNKPSSLIWMVFILLIILPTPAGKFIIDLAGGIFLIITIIPLVLGGVGWFIGKESNQKYKPVKLVAQPFLTVK